MSHTGRLVCLGLLLFGTRAEARGCHEVSEIVGEQRCSHFGTWDAAHTPALVIGLGPSVELNPLIGSRFSVSAGNAQGSVPLSGIPGRDFQDRGVAIAPFNLRMTMFPRRVFYLGFEASWGSYGFPSGPAHPRGADAGPLAYHTTDFFMLWLGAVAGASLPVGRFDLSVEVLGGFRAINPNLEFDDEAAATKALGGCWLDAKQKQVCPGTPVTNFAVDARLEPRASIGIRISQSLTARVLVGVDALDWGAVHVAAVIEMHMRSYDGFFVRRANAAAR